jgi:S-adenosylmethionine-dependent methyltransferase
MSETSNNYDSIAEEYDDKTHSGYREKIQDSIVFIVLDGLIGEEIHILDAGGGKGHYSLPYASKEHRITILDISSKKLEVAESNAQTMNVSDLIEIIHGDMSSTSLPVESFDFVMCHLALCHVKNPLQTLREFSRLLRKD